MIDGFAYTDTSAHQDRILSILRLLRPFDVAGATKLRLGRDFDGGYVMIDDFVGATAAYSFGIKDDVSWDKDMAARGVEVFQYDHTIDALPEEDPRFHWSQIGVCGVDEDCERCLSLPELMALNGHHDDADLILKMDVEGAEWRVFASTPPALLRPFRQIVCEFHGFQHVDLDEFYARALACCRNLAVSHRVVHVHANNNTAFSIVGGVPVPACLEISFVRIDGREITPSRETFPTPLDMPCSIHRADYQLGRFEY